MGTIKRNFYNNITPTGKFDSADLTGTIPATNVADASLTNVTSVPATVGDFVQKTASDPSPASAGDVWYNTTSNALKSVVALEAWSSGAPLITGVQQQGAFGTQSAALSFGGIISGPANTTNTEEYNGSGWASGGAMNTARGNLLSSWGVQTAGIAATGSNTGGTNLSNVEEYNGSTWTAKNTVSTARRQAASIGQVTTAGAIAGGYTPGSVNTNATEEFDGTNWTAGGNLNTTRRGFTGSGTLAAGVVYGGYTTTETAATEEYDGSTWTTSGNLNTARNNLAGSSNGPQTSSVAYGGSSPAITGTETYDGTTWTTSPATLSTGQNNFAGAGNGTSALSIGGTQPSSFTNLTEEYNKSVNVITAAAWVSGGNLGTARSNLAGSGTQTAGLATGGTTPTLTTSTEEYDGSAWTAGGAYPTPVTQASGFGIQTASIVCGGDSPGSPVANPGGVTSQTTSYNGSTWTQVNPMSQARYNAIGAGCGTQTAGLIAGGDDGITSPSDDLSAVEEYDGTSWTAATSLTTARGGGGINIGTQTAAIVAYGTNPGAGGPPGFTTWFEDTEIYNGSTWTAGPKTNTLRRAGVGASGTLTNGLAFGGYFNPVGAIDYTEKYDGTSWATQPVLSTARYAIGGASNGTADAALGMGGYTTTFVATTEEFTGETSAANIVTITSS